MRQLTQKSAALNGLPASVESRSTREKPLFIEARKAYLRILRRLTLWFRLRWANPELVEFPAPSRPAQRDVAKTVYPCRPRSVSKGLFLQAKQTRGSWRRANNRVTLAWRTCRFGRSPTTNRQHRIILPLCTFLKTLHGSETGVSASFPLIYDLSRSCL